MVATRSSGSSGAATTIEADLFADGHDHLIATVRWRRAVDRAWATIAMTPLGNDRFEATVEPVALGRHEFEVRARVDEYRTWLSAYDARSAAGLDLSSERAVGAMLLAGAADLARGTAAKALAAAADAFAAGEDLFLSDLHDLGSCSSISDRPVDGVDDLGSAEHRGRPGACSDLVVVRAVPPFRRLRRCPCHGTLADVERRLPYVAGLGFDVLYLPPIHPIGTTNRKGPLGRPAEPADPGSPWAIGGPAGGHTAIHPDLGTIDDFDHLVVAAGELGIEIALDYAAMFSRPPVGHRASRVVPPPSRRDHRVRREPAQAV